MGQEGSRGSEVRGSPGGLLSFKIHGSETVRMSTAEGVSEGLTDMETIEIARV